MGQYKQHQDDIYNFCIMAILFEISDFLSKVLIYHCRKCGIKKNFLFEPFLCYEQIPFRMNIKFSVGADGQHHTDSS